jgi:predicted metal-dependent phosphotriesterase family hydrolase
MIRTVHGQVSIKSDSFVLPHEHVSIDYGQMTNKEQLISSQKIKDFIDVYSRLKVFGVGVVVDCTPPFYGRDLSLLRHVSEASGISIIASTGTFCEEWHPLPKFVYGSSEEELLRFFTDELNSGCGNIKVAMSRRLQDVELKALRAAGRAQLESGATIVCHTTGGLGEMALDVFSRLGVPLNKVTIAHVCAHSEPVDYAIELAKSGAYVGFDKIGHSVHEDEYWIQLISELKTAGQISRVLLSQDTALSFTGPDLIGEKVFDNPNHLFLGFKQMLLQRPELKNDFDLLLGQNPKAWLES